MKLIESLREKASKAVQACGDKLDAPPELHQYWDALINDMEPECFIALVSAVEALRAITNCAIRDALDRETNYVNTADIQASRAALAALDALERS